MGKKESIGISTATFFGKFNNEDSIDLINKLGFKTAEVFLSTFCEYESDFGALLKSRQKKLNIYSVHSLNSHFEPQLYNHVERTRNDSEVWFKKVCSVGKMLGAKAYTFHGAPNFRNLTTPPDYDYIGLYTNKIIDVASRYGLRLSYENVSWTRFNAPDFFINLSKRCPDLYATLDIKQAHISGVDYREFIKAAGGRLNNVHLCDYDEAGNLLPCGQGIFDFKRLFKILRDGGYDGPYIMELYSDNYKTLNEINAAYDFLSDCLDGL
jgi:sugar phosphate isomerase/epimerase